MFSKGYANSDNGAGALEGWSIGAMEDLLLDLTPLLSYKSNPY